MESRSPEGLRILVKKLNQGPYDRFGGRLPRSPVWLRKIPSTVSGSQGSRRGLRPAVRFAFPLGARLNTTLRARPCQELFSESFSRPSRGPRGAPPSGLLPFAAASSVLYAPPAPRVRETRPHTGCRQLQRGKAEGVSGGGRHRAGASPRPACGASGAAVSTARIQLPIYRQEDRSRLRAGSLPRRHASGASPCRRLSPVRFRQASRGGGSLPKEERPPPGPPAFRAGNPLDGRPWSILYVGRFPSFRYLRSLGATAYSNAQAFPLRPILRMYAEAPLARS